MPRSTSSLDFDKEQPQASVAYGVSRTIIGGRDGQLEAPDERASSFKRPGEGPALQEYLRWLARSLTIMALLSSFALLCVGATPFLTVLPAYLAKGASHAWFLIKRLPLSALPLLLAGSSYLILQAILRPRPLELLKRLMLGAAFLLWGVVQLMPASNLAAELGNLVIALYVVDLGLIIWTELQKSALEAVR
jgi:hypothetical protein